MQKRVYYTDAQIEQLMLVGQKAFTHETFSNPRAKAEAIQALKSILGQSGSQGPQTLFDYIETRLNASGETDLYSSYIETRFFNHTGTKIKAEYSLSVNQGTGIVRTINLYFNGTLIYTGGEFGQSDLAANPQTVKVDVLIIKISSTQAKAIVRVSGDATTLVNDVTETNIILGTETSWNLKITGAATSAGGNQPNQIKANFGYIETKPSSYIETRVNGYIETFVEPNQDSYIET